MADSAGLDPTLARGAPPAGRETASPDDPGAGSGPNTPAGPLTLETSLLGLLIVPDGAAPRLAVGSSAAEIAELSRRAALYATRARGDGTRRACRAAWHQ